MSAATRPRSGRSARKSDLAARKLERSPRRRPARPRRLVALVLAAAVLLTAYLLVVRDLPLFRVETVQLRGASSAFGPQLRTELLRSARTMTTLHVREDELLRVARRYPAVVSLTVDPRLPNGLQMKVVERPPVGVVNRPRRGSVPVAADGTLLAGQPLDRPLPRLPGRAREGRGRGGPLTRAAARLAAGAPPGLAAWLEAVRRGKGGWVVTLRDGPELRFGPPSRLPAKWAAAAAVLAARDSRGARYIDLRLPDRPAAGGFAERSERRIEGSDKPQPVLEGSPQP